MLLTGRVDVEIPQKLKDLFKDSPIVVNGPTQGNAIKDDGTLVLGLRSGPSQDLDALIHEMSHFVEIDEPRMLMKSWGLDYKTKVTVYGKEYDEPLTPQAVERECRVIAYQNNLKSYLGLPLDIENDVLSLHFLLDWYHVPSGLSRGVDEVEKARLDWCADAVRRSMKSLNLELFFEIWHHRNAILNSRLQVRQAA